MTYNIPIYSHEEIEPENGCFLMKRLRDKKGLFAHETQTEKSSRSEKGSVSRRMKGVRRSI